MKMKENSKYNLIFFLILIVQNIFLNSKTKI